MGIPLVTGAAGFAGSHLVAHLLDTEPAVTAWSNPGGHPPDYSDARVRWRAVDLLNGPAVEAAIAELRPSAIYHCAGFASVGAGTSDSSVAVNIDPAEWAITPAKGLMVVTIDNKAGASEAQLIPVELAP